MVGGGYYGQDARVTRRLEASTIAGMTNGKLPSTGADELVWSWLLVSGPLPAGVADVG